MKKSVLVLGGSGMAGHIVTKYLEETEKYDVINTCHNKLSNEKSIVLDIFDREKIVETLKNIKPNIVINCIGILTKKANDNPELAVYINSYFPRLLEQLGPKMNFKTIHLSTDCIFSGEKGNYTVFDIPDAKDMYGKSKALGELKNDRDLTIRTSFIGPELNENGVGLFHWFMNQHGIVNGYSNVFWTGLTTLELSKVVKKAIEMDLTGLHQIVPQEKISKYELLKLIQTVFCKDDVKIVAFQDKKLDKSLILSVSFLVQNYYEMMRELKYWMVDHKYMYSKIYGSMQK